jgi:hypothetical protein
MTTELSYGLFATGIMVGIVFSYTNICGFFMGIITGIAIQHCGPEIGDKLLHATTNVFYMSIQYIKFAQSTGRTEIRTKIDQND